MTAADVGRKDDTEKPRWDLLPFDALEQVVAVLSSGAVRYGAWNWRHVDRWQGRYLAAMLRHISAYARGEYLDRDSGQPHLAHAICSAMFLLSKHGEASAKWSPRAEGDVLDAEHDAAEARR